MVMLPAWVSVPERVDELSASRTPPLIAIVEARVPASVSFNEPAVTVIAPERLLPDAIDTGVMLATEREVIVELLLTSIPKLLFTVVLALPTVIEFRRSLLFALFSTKAFVLLSVPPPLNVRVFAPRLTAVPE